MIKRKQFQVERVRFAARVLRDAGIRDDDIETLYLGRHSSACACWQCVMRLHRSAVKHVAQMRARIEVEEMRSRTERFRCEPCSQAKLT